MKNNGQARLRRSIQNEIPDLEAIRKEVLKEGFAELADSRSYLEGSQEMKKNENRRTFQPAQDEKTVRGEKRGTFGGPPRGPKFWLGLAGGFAAAVLALVLILPRLNQGNTLPAELGTTLAGQENAAEQGDTDYAGSVDSTGETVITNSGLPEDDDAEIYTPAYHPELIEDVEGTPLITHLHRGGGSFRLENTSDSPYTYGEGYQLMRLIEDEWVLMELQEEMIVPAIGYELAPQATDYIYASWQNYYGELENGTYRYINAGLYADFEITESTPAGAGYQVPPIYTRAEVEMLAYDSDVILTADIADEDLAQVTVTIENTGEIPYTYGDPYMLLIQVAEEADLETPEIERWAYVPMLPNRAFNLPAYTVSPESKKTKEFNLNHTHYLEEPGEYSLLMGFSNASDYEDRFTVAVPMTVTQAMIDKQPEPLYIDPPVETEEPNEPVESAPGNDGAPIAPVDGVIIYQDEDITAYEVGPDTSQEQTWIEIDYVNLEPEEAYGRDGLVATGIVTNMREVRTYYHGYGRAQIYDATLFDFTLTEILRSDDPSLTPGDTITVDFMYNSYMMTQSVVWPQEGREHLIFLEDSAFFNETNPEHPDISHYTDYYVKLAHAMVFPKTSDGYQLNFYYMDMDPEPAPLVDGEPANAVIESERFITHIRERLAAYDPNLAAPSGEAAVHAVIPLRENINHAEVSWVPMTPDLIPRSNDTVIAGLVTDVQEVRVDYPAEDGRESEYLTLIDVQTSGDSGNGETVTIASTFSSRLHSWDLITVSEGQEYLFAALDAEEIPAGSEPARLNEFADYILTSPHALVFPREGEQYRLNSHFIEGNPEYGETAERFLVDAASLEDYLHDILKP